MKSLSLLIGYYPDEFYFSQLVRHHEYNQLHVIISESLILMYVLIYGMFIILSIFYQYYSKEEINKDEKYEKFEKLVEEKV